MINPRCIFLSVVLSLSMVLLQGESPPNVNAAASIESSQLEISSVCYDKTVYFEDDISKAKVSIRNKGKKTVKLWLGYSLKDPSNNWIDINPSEINLAGLETKEVYMNYKLENLPTGAYSSVFALWDSFPINENSKRLANFETSNAFSYFKVHETFNTLNENMWVRREGTLGGTELLEENVFISDKLLNIRLPKDRLQGGEIQSIHPLGFGAYEVSLKLPDSPSSITGFFLYKQPDFFHEIDIEIFNKKNSEVLFTSYKDGKVQKEYRVPLEFDPTANFHKYRIEFYEKSVRFFVDDKLYHQIDEGFSTEDMYLILNAWYPHWLEGVPNPYDSTLKAEWIRY